MRALDKYIAFLVFSIAVLVTFIFLGKAEIQPWDEGLYANRAAAALVSGNMLDQTPDSMGGLYSSTPPPLSVWAIEASVSLFGASEFAVRLFPAICSIISLLMLYLTTLKLSDKKSAALAAFSLATAYLWNFYSRQAMTESPMICLILTTIVLANRLISDPENKNILLNSLLLALSIAAALLTKNFISFYNVSIAISAIFFASDKTKRIAIVSAILLGILLAAPWHYTMIANHGAEFYKALFPAHIAAAVENNSRASGLFYYANGLIVSAPIAILALISLIRIKTTIKEVINKDSFLYLSILLWFVLSFVAFSLSATKNPHYTLYILAPAIIIACKYLSSIVNSETNKNRLFSILILLVLGFAWTIIPNLRDEVKALAHFKFGGGAIAFFSVVAISFLFRIWLNKSANFQDKYRSALWAISFIICLTLSGKLIADSARSDAPEIKSGAKGLARLISNQYSEKNSIIYLFEKYNDADSLNPQLEWYFRLGNVEALVKSQKLSIPSNGIDSVALNKFNYYPDKRIIYYIPGSNKDSKNVYDYLAKQRAIIYHYGNYIFFDKLRLNKQ
jgi:4-amino-4-deoxy-L-arabinose transferase-like glycosyltransferase